MCKDFWRWTGGFVSFVSRGVGTLSIFLARARHESLVT
jgi:hypothetical protein